MKKLLLFLSLAGVLRLGAQQSKPEIFAWESSGAGITSVMNLRPELCAGGSLNLSLNRQLFGFRALFCEELVIFRTPYRTYEFAAYYGRYFLDEGNDTYCALGGGISLVNYFTYGRDINSGQPFGTYHTLVPNYTGGLAIDVQAGLNIFRYVGVGVHAFLDANLKRTLAGAMFSVRLGYVRGPKAA